MFLLKKILSGLVMPPMGLILLACLGALAMRSASRRWRIAGTATVMGSVALLVALSIPAISQRLLASLEQYPAVSPAQLVGAEAIVLLGGGTYRSAPEYGGDTVGTLSLERTRYAARLARSTGLPLLVTGGTTDGTRPEAESMREVLTLEFSVPVRWVESQALDTTGNAVHSAALLRSSGVKRIVLVSHAWHLPRAVPLFEREGMAVIPAPTGFSSGRSGGWIPRDYGDARIALHEYLGRAVNWLVGKG